MVREKLRAVSSVDSPVRESPFSEPALVPSGEADFLGEVYAARRSRNLIQLFGETMSKKNSNKADAQQTKGS
jgi:hypothetical protein